MNTNKPDVQTSQTNGGSDTSRAIRPRCLLQDTIRSPFAIWSSVKKFLSTRLSADQLRTNYDKLELLKNSSFYIVLLRQDVPQPDNPRYISNSTLMQYIDMSRFQRVKRNGSNQVKLQLELLEILHSELTRGRQELEEILAGKGGTRLKLRAAKINEKILSLCQVADDFEAALIPAKLHVKHSLIPELESKGLPEFQLALEALKPVLFNREVSQAFCDSVDLHWYVAEQEQYKPDEEFEVSYKLITPTDMMEARMFGCLYCSTYAIKLTDLLPEHSYEFSIKRLDNTSLVYRVWNDTIVLTTTSAHANT